MKKIVKNELDPFRIIIGVLATRGDSDLLVGVVNAAGLSVDLTMPKSKDFSHKTRIRALLPKIFAAYEELGDQSRMAVANIAFRNFGKSYHETKDRAVKALVLAGWQIRDDELVVSSPDLREMFFPKGSEWDAHVVLRDIFDEAKVCIMVVDSYTDGTVFQMLTSRVLTGLTVSILCGNSGPAVAAEAKRFIAQYSDVIVEVRQTRDFHDRFIVIDNRICVHVGASIKDAGKTACMVSRVEDDKNRLAILAAISTSWVSAIQLL